MGRDCTPGAIAFAGVASGLESAPARRRLRTLVMSLLVGAAAALGCAAALVALHGGGAERASPARHGLGSLPVAAQGPISAALGRDQPAYRIRGLQALNPAQQLRLGFSRRGVKIAAGAARLGLTLSSYGYASALTPVAAATPRASANRVSYRDGSLTQWFANGPLGLEQGFGLAARPDTGSGPLTFSLALSGGMTARLHDGSVLLEGDGVSLRYGGLVATDARGRELRSWLTLVRGHVLIHVDDGGAHYPLRIDPFVQEAELSASNGDANDHFGYSVAVSGETIVVGAPGHKVGEKEEEGVAYVFTMPASGWASERPTAELTAKEGEEKELFGQSVAVSGDTIVVGAPRRKVLTQEMQGEAYVFVMPSSGWSGPLHETARLTVEDGEANEDLGEAVAVSGDTAVAGAPGRSDQQGAAYVFVSPSTGWSGSLTQTAELTAAGGEKEDRLGDSVAVAGNTVVAGAANHTVDSNEKQGAAYVYVASGGVWEAEMSETAELTDSPGQQDELFGYSLAISGNTIVVGAPGHTAGGGGEGAADVFVMPGAGWSSANPNAELAASDGAKGDMLGSSVAISGNTIVAGAPGDKLGEHEEQGATYLFAMPASGWTSANQTVELSAKGGEQKELLGRSVALAGDTVLAGAPGHKIGEQEQHGAAFVFQEPPSVKISSPRNGAVFSQGQVVAASYSCGTPPGTTVSCSGPVADGAAIETGTLGPHSFVVNASDSDALGAAQSANYTVVAASGVSHAAVRSIPRILTPTLPSPILKGLSETAARWREGSLLAKISSSPGSIAKKRPPLGTTFSFALNEPASVTFTFSEQLPGRKVGKSCVAQTNKNRRGRRCTRSVAAGTLTFFAGAGTGRVRFDGLISKHRKLKPGSYTLLVSATASGRHSPTGTLRFTIVRG